MELAFLNLFFSTCLFLQVMVNCLFAVMTFLQRHVLVVMAGLFFVLNSRFAWCRESHSSDL